MTMYWFVTMVYILGGVAGAFLLSAVWFRKGVGIGMAILLNLMILWAPMTLLYLVTLSLTGALE